MADAAAAFNAMQDRIAAHVAERMRILSAISHDLQTPITRMKLRSEFMEDPPDKGKLSQDLDEVEQLVREGLDYARSAHGQTEPTARIDLNAVKALLGASYVSFASADIAERLAGSVAGTILPFAFSTSWASIMPPRSPTGK